MKPASAKAKGRELQKKVRDKIIATFHGLTIHDVTSTSMGANGVDVKLSKAARKMFPYAIECKNLAQAAIYKMYDQSAANADKDADDGYGFVIKENRLEPIVVIRQNRRKPLVALDFEVFMEMAKEQWLRSQKASEPPTT